MPPTPYTLHWTPYTLHPTPHTLHPTLSALTPEPSQGPPAVDARELIHALNAGDVYPRELMDLLEFLAEPPRENLSRVTEVTVRIHVIIVMIRWTGLAPWEVDFPFPGSLTSTFLN